MLEWRKVSTARSARTRWFPTFFDIFITKRDAQHEPAVFFFAQRAAPLFPDTFKAEWPNLKASPPESVFFRGHAHTKPDVSLSSTATMRASLYGFEDIEGVTEMIIKG